ncbi:MAG TPA: DUF3099 domain-containing protein [Micrococcaceae bacterium]|jgi:hypothetical protein|nr:DUF3099 domain-containing protein [Micrococcaceae bacterium]
MKNRATADSAGTPADPADAYNITDAPVAHSDEMHQRLVKYSLTMGIRMVCLILVFVLDGWLKIIAMAGAVFLPWIAVVIANAGSDTTNEHAGALLDQLPQAELEAPRPADPDGDVVQGEVADEAGGSAVVPWSGNPAEPSDGRAEGPSKGRRGSGTDTNHRNGGMA